MRALPVLLALVSVARADERVQFVAAHASLRLPAGTQIANDGSAIVHDPDGRWSIVVARAPLATTDVRELVAADPELACARIERLPIAGGALAYAALPAVPRRVHDRALLVLVDALAPDGSVVSVRFYIEPGALAHADRSSRRARAIASTLELRLEPPAYKHLAAPPRPPLPDGWQLRSDSWHSRILSPGGECKVIDGELGAYATAPDGALAVDGYVHGSVVTWQLWAEPDGKHAELLADGTSWGLLHVVCHAPTLGELTRQRHVVEAQLQ